jgi:hypothetical protein
MSSLLSNFTSIEYLASNIVQYLEEIKYNASLLISLYPYTNNVGNSINWQDNTSDAIKICDGICEIIEKINQKNFGKYDDLDPYLFLFIIYYYSDYYTRSSVVFSELDIKYINKNSPNFIFNNGSSDSQIYNALETFMNDVTNILGAFQSINQ